MGVKGEKDKDSSSIHPETLTIWWELDDEAESLQQRSRAGTMNKVQTLSSWWEDGQESEEPGTLVERSRLSTGRKEEQLSKSTEWDRAGDQEPGSDREAMSAQIDDMWTLFLRVSLCSR